jgi:malonate transporter
MTAFWLVLPLFLVVLAGYVAGRRAWLSAEGIKGLTDFVFWFAIPCLLFATMARAPVDRAFDWRFASAMLAAALTWYAAGAVLSRFAFGCRGGEPVVFGFSITFGNTVFIGLPVAAAVLGEAAALPMAVVLTIENGLIIPMAVALLEWRRSREGALARAPLAAGKAVARNPIVLAAVGGLAWAVAGYPLPGLAQSLTGLIGGAAVPCALFALGATLASLPLSERIAETATISVLKLAGYPALIWATLSLLPDVDPVWFAAALIYAAMPSGANAFLIAQAYGTYIARASTAVLVTTTISVVTISLVAATVAP